MAKKTLALDGLVDPGGRRAAPGMPRREPPADRRSRLSVALDADTYRRLRLHAAGANRTHQEILEQALADYLERASA